MAWRISARRDATGGQHIAFGVADQTQSLPIIPKGQPDPAFIRVHAGFGLAGDFARPHLGRDLCRRDTQQGAKVGRINGQTMVRLAYLHLGSFRSAQPALEVLVDDAT